MEIAMQKSPHIAIKRTTRSIMIELFVALSVLFVYSAVWYYMKAGSEYMTHAILIGVISILTSMFADALWALARFWDKKVILFKDRLKNWGLQILDSYGFVSGIILALALPVGTRYYVVVVAAFVGTFFAKSIFGGFGKNIFNPALAGRVFVQICFPTALNSYLGTTAPTTIATGATINTITSGMSGTTNLSGASLLNLFLGNYRGALGETFAFLIIAIGLYLVIRNIIDWRISIFYVLSILLTALVIGLFSGMGLLSFEYSIREVMRGGVLFGAVFCLTDPVTSPTSRSGKIIYAVGAGLFTCLIRYQASAVEGVAYSVLLMNMLTPMIDRFSLGKSNQHLGKKAVIISSVVGISLIFGGAYGAFHKTADSYDSNVQVDEDNVGMYNSLLSMKKQSAGITSLGSYSAQESPEIVDGNVLSKVNLKLNGTDDVTYYELETNPQSSYTVGGYIHFSALIDDKLGVIGYKYLGGTENALGLNFSQRIIISYEHPYTEGDFTADQYSTDVGSTGASININNSTKTVPAIQATLKEAEIDAGYVFAPIDTSKVKYLNAILEAQGEKDVTSASVNDLTISGLLGDGSTVNAKFNGFTLGGVASTYYDITTAAVTIPENNNDSHELELGLVVNSNGIVGMATIDLSNSGYGKAITKALASSITSSAPYTKGQSIDAIIDATGASISKNQITTAMDAVITDYTLEATI